VRASKAIDNLTKNPLLFAGGIALLAYVAYSLARKTVVDTAKTAGGIVSGNNLITQSARTDAYTGTGVVGTAGAITDIATGGVLSRTGEVIGSTLYSWFHPSVNDWAKEIFYGTLFPDGSRHAISSLTIDANGYFLYAAKRYRMAVSDTGSRIAVAQ
jgi:hypothetical protein